jgi:hypothetical protein
MSPEEAVQMLLRLHPYGDQKKFEDAIHTKVIEAVLRAELEGFQQGYEDGKRRAVNRDGPRAPDLPPEACGFGRDECVFPPTGLGKNPGSVSRWMAQAAQKRRPGLRGRLSATRGGPFHASPDANLVEGRRSWGLGLLLSKGTSFLGSP